MFKNTENAKRICRMKVSQIINGILNPVLKISNCLRHSTLIVKMFYHRDNQIKEMPACSYLTIQINCNQKTIIQLIKVYSILIFQFKQKVHIADRLCTYIQYSYEPDNQQQILEKCTQNIYSFTSMQLVLRVLIFSNNNGYIY